MQFFCDTDPILYKFNVSSSDSILISSSYLGSSPAAVCVSHNYPFLKHPNTNLLKAASFPLKLVVLGPDCILDLSGWLFKNTSAQN